MQRLSLWFCTAKATEFRSAMKKTNAAPMEMYPTKNGKNVISPRTSSLYSTDGSIISSALTVPAIARDIVAINSRLVVLEKRSNDIIFILSARACKYKGEFFHKLEPVCTDHIRA